jgi:hypothetical protein
VRLLAAAAAALALGGAGANPPMLAGCQMFPADNGSSWFVSGVPDSRWDNDALHTLGLVKGSDFEVIAPSAIHP